jgi:ATP-binding cassette subfamily B protein
MGRKQTMSNFGSTLSNSQLVKRLLGMVWVYRFGCLRTLGLQVILLVLGLSGLGLTGVGVDYLRQVLAQRAGEAAIAPRWPFGLCPPDAWSPLLVLGVLSLSILLFAALRSLLNMYYTITMNQLLQGRVVVDLRSRVYAKMQQLSFSFFDAQASGAIINRVTGDVQAVRGFLDGVVLQSIILFLSLGVYLVYMLSIHVHLTLACLVTTPLLFIATTRFARRVRPVYAESRDLFDKQVLALSENVQGIHVIKGFGRAQEEIAKFEDATNKVRSRKRWIFKQVAFFQPLLGFLTQLNLVVLLAYGGYLVIRREGGGDGVSIGDLLVFTGLLQQFSGQVSNISTIADSMQQSLTSAQRVFDILDAPIAIQSKPDAKIMERAKGRIEFIDVEFGYKPDVPVLHSLNMTVEAGQSVAILGATGAGKTTLLSLIPRFYDVWQGRLLIDGVDVSDYEVRSLRQHIGIVFQDNFLFSNTVRANIAFGHPDATDAQVQRAARLAAADDFINALPNGYDTILREGGTNLSGGQRQRLSIARALLLDPRSYCWMIRRLLLIPRRKKEIMDAIESQRQAER